MKKFLIFLFLLSRVDAQHKKDSTNYADLVQLFKDWRSFEKPALINGVPDYSKNSFNKRKPVYQLLRQRLESFNISDWTVPNQIDWHIVRAEMNGYDFNQRVLKPWERDPAFYQSVWMYQSDVPAHEGPTNHAILEFWMYELGLQT